jgi:hypothetical protein
MKRSKQTEVLSNGTVLEIERHTLPSPAFGGRWEGKHRFRLFANRHVLTLSLRHPEQIFESAALAGAALQAQSPDSQFALALLLAFISVKRDLPEKDDAVRISEICAFLAAPAARDPRVLDDEDIRALARQSFVLRESEDLPPAPAGVWNAARYLLCCGEQAWQLRGEQARFWGSFPAWDAPGSEAERIRQQRGLLAKVAALGLTRQQRAALPLPVAPAAVLEFAWWDWIALAAGPTSPQRTLRPGWGLGEFRGSKLEASLNPYYLALSVEHSRSLETLARTLLVKPERPYPRYIGRVLALGLPLRLLPRLRGWGIDRLLVQVEAHGLYLSTLDRAGGCIGAAWWEPDPTPHVRVPSCFPAAAWMVLHAVCAALWRDLCANAIVVGPRPSPLTSGAPTGDRGGGKKRRKKRPGGRISLPPVRSAPARAEEATWAEGDDQERIERTARTANWYRLLPGGWEQREAKPDFQRRRAQAIARARAALQPDPPPGFTFVHRLTEEERLARLPDESPPIVRARGLLALSLVLQEQAIEFATREEEQDPEGEG